MQDFSYKVRYTRRKTLGLYIHRNGDIEVRAPRAVAQRTIVNFVEQNVSWIEKQLATLGDRVEHARLSYEAESTHYFLGSPQPLAQLLQTPSHILDAQDPAYTQQQLREWYRLEAKLRFPRILHRYESWLSDHGLDYPEIRIRSMRRRWGSCSSLGHINLNLWLIRLPEEAIAYVIAHELSHLLEFNHSSRFYRILDDIMPEWKSCKQELEAHPAALAMTF